MKQLSTMILITFLAMSCVVEKEKSSSNSNASSSEVSLNQNQIGITSDTSKVNVERFVSEIKARQEQSPDTMFEVVRVDQEKTSSSIKLSSLKDNSLYPNKNFYVFIGLGANETDRTIQKTDWDAIYSIMNYVAEKKFRVLINVQATKEHLRLASEDEDTSIILWSSHGNTSGFYDYNKERIPYDIFKTKSKGFYQLILSSCYGRVALKDFYDTTGLRTSAWTGLTSSEELKQFLLSDRWSALEGQNLSPIVSGVTCTKFGSEYDLMQTDSRKSPYGDFFSSLRNCEERLNSIQGNYLCTSGPEGVKRLDVRTFKVLPEAYSSINECLERGF